MGKILSAWPGRVATSSSVEGALHSMLVSLCRDDERCHDESWWRSLKDKTEAEAFLDLAWAEGVFPNVYASFRKWNDPIPRFESRSAALEQGRARLLAALPRVSDRVIVLKGFGLEATYPVGRRRAFTDADIIVPTIDQFWPIARELCASSYDMGTTMIFYRDAVSKQICGSARFYPAPPLPDRFGEVEVQIGMYPITFCTQLPYDEFARTARRVSTAGIDFRMPAVADHLLVLLAGFEGKRRVTIRDAYDWIRLLLSDADVDIAAVLERADFFAIDNGLAVLAEGLARLRDGGLPPRVEEFLHQPRVRAARRRASNLPHMWRYFRHIESSKLPLKRLALQALRALTLQWNHQDRFLPLLKAMDASGCAKYLFDTGYATYLVRLSHQSHGWTWLQKRGHAVVCTPIGHFVATTNAVLSDQDLDFLTDAVAGSLAS